MKKFILAIVMTVMCLGMTACASANMVLMEYKMDLKGYNVRVTEINENGCVGEIRCASSDKGIVTAWLFESTDAASDYYARISHGYRNAVLDGKWVYTGTEEAMDDFGSIF